MIEGYDYFLDFPVPNAVPGSISGRDGKRTTSELELAQSAAV